MEEEDRPSDEWMAGWNDKEQKDGERGAEEEVRLVCTHTQHTRTQHTRTKHTAIHNTTQGANSETNKSAFY